MGSRRATLSEVTDLPPQVMGSMGCQSRSGPCANIDDAHPQNEAI